MTAFVKWFGCVSVDDSFCRMCTEWYYISVPSAAMWSSSALSDWLIRNLNLFPGLFSQSIAISVYMFYFHAGKVPIAIALHKTIERIFVSSTLIEMTQALPFHGRQSVWELVSAGWYSMRFASPFQFMRLIPIDNVDIRVSKTSYFVQHMLLNIDTGHSPSLIDSSMTEKCCEYRYLSKTFRSCRFWNWCNCTKAKWNAERMDFARRTAKRYVLVRVLQIEPWWRWWWCISAISSLVSRPSSNVTVKYISANLLK